MSQGISAANSSTKLSRSAQSVYSYSRDVSVSRRSFSRSASLTAVALDELSHLPFVLFAVNGCSQ